MQSTFAGIAMVMGLLLSIDAQARPGENVQFIDYPQTNARSNAAYGEVLLDVMRHEAPNDHNSYDDKITMAHETSHGIHAYLRNRNQSGGKRVNAFYVLNDQAALVEEPPIRKSAVARYVPSNLRGSRYDLYVVGQSAWDDTPLYLWDEWNAYVLGAEAGVDLVERGLWSGWTDAVMGPLEFVVYAVATAMAVKDQAPSYFSSNQQFREFLAYNIERSMQVYNIGSQMTEFRWDRQDDYFEKFKTSAEATSMRQFLTITFGADWTNEVFGF